MTILDEIKQQFHGLDDEQKIELIESIKDVLHQENPIQQPIDRVYWVDVEKVEANDYNPNSVAGKEMKLLYTSIKHDGYTQPVVTIFDQEKGKYVIVDGFHRYFVCKSNQDIRDRNKGRLPVVVIEKDINERMAATVRHNRARGAHSVDGMSNMVFSMLNEGWTDAEICNHLGMEPDELLRLKHITGFSKLFENAEYKKSWETKQQILYRKNWKQQEDASK